MKNIQDLIKFNQDFPAHIRNERESHECHCGNAFVTELVYGKRTVIFGIDCEHSPKGLLSIYPLPPETYECNDKLANLLINLRTNQRAFFAARPGTDVKLTALTESKRLEKELDQFLKERNQVQQPAQSDLFNQ